MSRNPKSSVGEMVGRRQYEAVVTTAILIDAIIEESKLHDGHGNECPFSDSKTMKEVGIAQKILSEIMISYQIHNQSERFGNN